MNAVDAIKTHKTELFRLLSQALEGDLAFTARGDLVSISEMKGACDLSSDRKDAISKAAWFRFIPESDLGIIGKEIIEKAIVLRAGEYDAASFVLGFRLGYATGLEERE